MKRSELKRIPAEQLMDFCDGEMNELRFAKRKLIRIAELRPEWSALDVLDLPERGAFSLSEEAKVLTVLMADFLPADLLRLFALRCAVDLFNFSKVVKAPIQADSLDYKKIELAVLLAEKWIHGAGSEQDLSEANALVGSVCHNSAFGDVEYSLSYTMFCATEVGHAEFAFDTALVAAPRFSFVFHSANPSIEIQPAKWGRIQRILRQSIGMYRPKEHDEAQMNDLHADT